MECLGLHNKPKAEVHLGHKLRGPKEEEEEEEEEGVWDLSCILYFIPQFSSPISLMKDFIKSIK
jgi:hypothetical protein